MSTALPPVGADDPPAIRAPVARVAGLTYLKTNHFLIGFDAREQVVQPLIDLLESTYAAALDYGMGLGMQIEIPTEPLPVLFFDRPEALE